MILTSIVLASATALSAPTPFNHDVYPDTFSATVIDDTHEGDPWRFQTTDFKEGQPWRYQTTGFETGSEWIKFGSAVNAPLSA